jgi:hypothetical protein
MNNCIVIHGFDALWIFGLGFVAAVILMLAHYWLVRGRLNRLRRKVLNHDFMQDANDTKLEKK